MLSISGLTSLRRPTTWSFSKGITGHLFSGNNKNAGPFIQGKNFLLFFGEIILVPTSAGFNAVGQYLQSNIQDESRISAKRASTKMQNLLALFHIK